MSKVIEVQLDWKYTPSDYLEEPVYISEDGFELSISDGLAVAKIAPSLFEEDPEIREYLTSLIESRLQAVQIMSHADYDLNKPSRSDIREDGGKNIFVEVEPAIIKVSCGPVDLVVKDRDGNIVSDSRQERLIKQKWFANAVKKHRSTDYTLDQMLKSYQMAVKDPNNEFVHLYEVRDSLSERFGNKKKAIQRLCITRKEWDTIGDLANKQPLKQGRHRGKSAGKLREADLSELKSARKSIANLIEKYLVYLENEGPLTSP